MLNTEQNICALVVKLVDTKDLKSTYNNPHYKTNTLA